MNSPASSILVRPYSRKDRGAVRRISVQTADAGVPFRRILADPGILPEMLTRYYTDYESDWFWVAEEGGAVVGYVCGCPDTRRYERIMRRKILPRVVARAAARGLLFRPSVIRFLSANLPLWIRALREPGIDLARFPAHCHINIASGSRRTGTGTRLLDMFLDKARRESIPGVHVGVRADNADSLRFFERFGFRPLAEPIPFLRRSAAERPLERILLGLEMENRGPP